MSITKKLFKNISNKKYLEILPNLNDDKAQAFTTLVLTLIALSFFGIFAISPTLSTIAQLRKQLSDNEIVYEKLQEKLNNLVILEQKYSLLENDLPVIFSAIPQKPNSPTLLGQIQTLDQESNIMLERIQSSQVELTKLKDDVSGYSSFAFSFDGQSLAYQEFLDLLSSLTNFDRIITIDSISTNFTEKDNALKISLRGKAYFKK